jgi:hypothetical protein
MYTSLGIKTSVKTEYYFFGASLGDALRFFVREQDLHPSGFRHKYALEVCYQTLHATLWLGAGMFIST